ncbi:MAG: hypothetical protein AAF514_12945, partial [Verrucomicrobiota bacterium]
MVIHPISPHRAFVAAFLLSFFPFLAPAGAEVSPDVRKAVEGYLRASSVDDKVAQVRAPKKLKGAMHDWYGKDSLESVVPESMSSFDLQLHGEPFSLVTTTLSGGASRRLFVDRSGNVPRVDWATDVLFQEGRNDEGIYRVILESVGSYVRLRWPDRPGIHLVEIEDEAPFRAALLDQLKTEGLAWMTV